MEQQEPRRHDKIRNNILQFIVFLAIVSLFVFGSSWLSRSFNTNREDIEDIVNDVIVDKVVLAKPKCENSFDGYLALKKQDKAVKIVDNKSSFARNKQFVSDIRPTVLISGA